MTTEHVSVPREFLDDLKSIRDWHVRRAKDIKQGITTGQWLIHDRIAERLATILSRATPSDELQGAFAECYTSEKGLAMLRDPECGISTVARVKTEYSCIPLFLQQQPTAPRVVTADALLNTCVGWVQAVAVNGSLAGAAIDDIRQSFATSLPVEIPPGYVLVPVEPTEDMYDEVESLTRCEELDLRAIYKAMLAAAPQPEKQG